MFVRARLFGWAWGNVAACLYPLVCGFMVVIWVLLLEPQVKGEYVWAASIEFWWLYGVIAVYVSVYTCAYSVLSLDNFLITRAIWVITFIVVLWLVCFMVVVLNGIGSRVVLSPICSFKLILWVRHGELFPFNTYTYTYISCTECCCVYLCCIVLNPVHGAPVFPESQVRCGQWW